MPLESHLPPIDDRRFDDIMAEVRARVPRYTPEWTDLNDSDPGITLLQVFAWMTELLTYRMGLVPELNYLKFLELLGIELKPAEPARAEISFPVKEDHSQPYLFIPARTQVSAEAANGAPPLIFETVRALTALTARIASVQTDDGRAVTDVTRVNEDGAPGFQPFGPLAADGSALLLGFRYPRAMPSVELDLAVILPPEGTTTAALQCGAADSLAFAPARLVWEYWNGAGWASLDLLKDETRAFTRPGHVHLKLPVEGSMQRADLDIATELLYWIRAQVERSQYERPPVLLAIRTNTVPAEQTETIRDEVLGGSDGSRNQQFSLENKPVVNGSLVLEIDEGSGFQPWTRVDDLYASGRRDPHYVLDRSGGEIRFGDGMNGHVPAANPSNPGANVVVREYSFGGGRGGNLPARAIKTLLASIDGIDENAVGNLQPSHGGRDEETLAEAKKRAPLSIRSRDRAVTASDYEYLATQAASIKRARALPLFHPGFPSEVKVPGVVTVIVVPDADEKTPNPLPSPGTLRSVCAYLEPRRLLTTELYVIAPAYQRVEIRAEVLVADNADLAEVKQGIDKTLDDYFHPLRGGEDGQGWPFGGTIFYSRVYQRVFTVPGTQSIEQLIIRLDGEEKPACTDVPIRSSGLLYSTGHQVQVRYRFDE